MERKNIWMTYGEGELQELHKITEKYKECLDKGKTERECVTLTVEMAEAAGYRSLEAVLEEGKALVVGDKVYA
ncbi:MAG: aminopeptidase, partial [Agathobacter sp.]|nr:aminopeptidase [Agathobacter sp.]